MSDETMNVGGATVTLKDQAAETPSAAIVKAAQQPIVVTDELGRSITVKKPAPLASLDFSKAAGAAGMNQLYLMEVLHLKYVAAIDGAPVATPTSDGELRALYSRLGDEGNEAVQKAVIANFGPKEDGADALKNF